MDTGLTTSMDNGPLILTLNVYMCNYICFLVAKILLKRKTLSTSDIIFCLLTFVENDLMKKFLSETFHN